MTHLDQVRRIYEDGFAEHLRAPFEDLFSTEHGQRALVFGEDRPTGLAVLRPLADTGWMFLRYFVVDTAQRGRGLGSQLWKTVTSTLSAEGSTMLVFDVEDPDEADCSPQEKEIRLRRIAFYERNGAILLPINGYLTPHGDDWGPMKLMAAPLDGFRDWTARDVVLAVYRHRWGLAVDHPTVLNALGT